MQRRGKARVEIEVRDLVDTDTGHTHCLTRRRGNRRRVPHLVVLGHQHRIVGVAPTAHVHALVGGYTELVGLRVRREQQRGRHVDVHHRDHVLRIRVADHSVVGARIDDVVDRALDRVPRIRVRGRDPGHRRHHLADRVPVLGETRPEVRPTRVVEHAEREPRLHHLVCDLDRLGRPLPRVGPLVLGRVRVLIPFAALLVQLLGRERLGAGDERDLHLASQHRFGRVVHEHLRRRAADP